MGDAPLSVDASHHAATVGDPMSARRPLVAAGITLGIGMGGFVDGIVLHQLLQVHHMVSAKYPTRGVELQQLAVNLEINMFWDGVFHAFTWLMTALGLVLLWNAVRRDDVVLSSQALFGSMIAGWGLFNLVEGIIGHHLLHVHHVVELPNHLLWDLTFLGFGAVLVAVGILLIRTSLSEPLSSHRKVPRHD